MKMQKSPWYKNPYWLGGIALGVVVIALVLFLALRGGEDKKPDTPDQPNIEEPTPGAYPRAGTGAGTGACAHPGQLYRGRTD